MARPSLSAALKSRMNYLVDRQAVLSGNIANASTPGYLAKDISFKPYVAAAQGNMRMAVTSAGHAAGNSAGMARSTMKLDATFIEHNGNAVRLDEQFVKMNNTKLDYQLITQIYAKQATMQRLAIGRQQ